MDFMSIYFYTLKVSTLLQFHLMLNLISSATTKSYRKASPLVCNTASHWIQIPWQCGFACRMVLNQPWLKVPTRSWANLEIIHHKIRNCLAIHVLFRHVLSVMDYSTSPQTSRSRDVVRVSEGAERRETERGTSCWNPIVLPTAPGGHQNIR